MTIASSLLERSPMKRTVGAGATFGFALAFIALLVSGWLSYRNLLRISSNENLVVHTHEVLDGLRDVIATLAAAESNQRSYLLTGEKVYLDPYQAAANSVQNRVEQVQRLVRDNPIQLERLAKLKLLVTARLASLANGITTYDRGGVEESRRYVLQGQGRHEMDSVRRLVSEMESTERQLLTTREEESRLSYQTAVVTVLTTTLLGLGLVVTAYLLTLRELSTRERGVEALARANDELENRVEARTADLNLANEALRRSNRELEQFASVASHDLQEPLRKIQAFGDRLQTRCSGELGEQGRDYLTRMLASATRMRSLIDALLTFSRVTTKAQPFVLVDLATTAEEVVSDLEERIHRTDGRVELGPLPTIEADPLQMRQLFQNLIGNGLKFARPGSPPIVKVQSRHLETTELDGNATSDWEISVSDDGIGFEEVYLDRIFELFQRLHGRHEYEGTGMGLAICRKIVQRHGGTISAHSVPERGATFFVRLPQRQT